MSAPDPAPVAAPASSHSALPSTTPAAPAASSAPAGAPPELSVLLAQHASLVAVLRSDAPLSDAAACKEDIIALFRSVDAAAAYVAELKESVRALAAEWKERTGHVSATAPVLTQRVDHLGASTFVEKGWSRLALGDAAAAEDALRKAMALAPGDAHAEALFGWALMLQERYDEALLTFHGILLREPQHALARANVGYVCLRKGIYGEAIEHLATAIRLDTDARATLYAHLYLGQVYFEREMFDDAQLFLRRALALGPNLLQAYFELGRAHWFAGDREGARQAWRSGAAANTFNPWGKRCADVLAKVEQGESPPAVGEVVAQP